MSALEAMFPYVHAAHYYPFPRERSPGERNRIGYCYNFNLIAEGRGTVVIEDRVYPVRKGDLVLIRPLQRHTFFTEAPYLYTTYNIYCDLWPERTGPSNPLITFHTVNPAHLVRMQPCAEIERLPAVIPLRHRPLLSDMLARLYQLYELRTDASLRLAGSYLRTFVLELCEQPAGEPQDYRIVRLIERLEQGELDDLPVTLWAERAGLAATQFHALFKRATGLTPHAWRIRRRMERAVSMLIESTSSVSEIAGTLGYPSIHPFTKQFVAHYGVSPSAYRGSRIDRG